MSFATSRDGTRIGFTVQGSGPPVVLVDGAFCSRGAGPTPTLAPALAEHFTVYSYDRRGRGDSGDTRPYSVTREVEDLAAVIDGADGPVTAVGISSGAALVVLAANHGLPLGKLALYEPPFMPQAGDRPPAGYCTELERLIDEGRHSRAARYFMTTVIGMPAPLVTALHLVPSIRAGSSAVAPTLLYDAAIMGDFTPPADALAAVAVPTLVIGGAKSPARLRRAVISTAGGIPGSTYRLLPGQNHTVSAKAVGPVLRDFIEA